MIYPASLPRQAAFCPTLCVCVFVSVCVSTTVYPCVEFRRVFRRSTSTMQKIGASDGDRCREGNLAAGTVPDRLRPRQSQQGGGQIKKTERWRGREREKKGERSSKGWKEIEVNSRGVYIESVTAMWIQQYAHLCHGAEWKCVPTCYVTCLQE